MTAIAQGNPCHTAAMPGRQIASEQCFIRDVDTMPRQSESGVMASKYRIAAAAGLALVAVKLVVIGRFGGARHFPKIPRDVVEMSPHL